MNNSKQTNPENPIIVQKYLEYREKNPQKRFDSLPGHQKRALDSEADIQVEAFRLSQTYGNWTKNKENAALLHEAYTEYYAAHPVLIDKLTEADRNELYLHPDTFERKAHRAHWAQRLADKIDAKAAEGSNSANEQRFGYKEIYAFAAANRSR